MANRRAMKLFAVAMVAGASTAHADTSTQATRGYGDGARAPSAAAESIDWNSNIDIMSIKPRQLANGRAAVGNTGGKPLPTAETYATAETLVTPEQRALFAASREYEAAQREQIIVPRLLANYRPACGNTGGKAERPDDCTAKEIRAVEAYDQAYERAAAKRYEKVSAAYTKLMAATTSAVRADPSLRARLLINGRPACGNTMGKSSPPEFCRGGGAK